MFGHIDGIAVGDIFEDRKHLRASGIHAPMMAGIWGAQEGAYSIVLSGGYEDDIDELDYILYTGQGGQDVPGGKQVADQEYTKGNLGLRLSCEYGLPVRVTRGHQIKNGPEMGYRYDGLYRVEKYERVKGKRGFYICRFHLVSEQALQTLETTLAPNMKLEYQRVERSKSTTNRLKRNPKISEKIKEIYAYSCQVCGVFLQAPSGPIAIGAHIMPLGQPHNGPDVKENLLCLCPNHHDQFDALGFSIEPNSSKIVGLSNFQDKMLTIDKKHGLGANFLKHHWHRWVEAQEGT